MALTVFDSTRKRNFLCHVIKGTKAVEARFSGVAGGRALLLVAVLPLAACEPRAQSAADWGRHDAYQFCNAAIADYPTSPAPPCEAMHMCLNEGALSDA